MLLRGSGHCSGGGGDAAGVQEGLWTGSAAWWVILDVARSCWTLVGGVGCVALARWLLGQVLCCDAVSCVRSPSLLGYGLS